MSFSTCFSMNSLLLLEIYSELCSLQGGGLHLDCSGLSFFNMTHNIFCLHEDIKCE